MVTHVLNLQIDRNMFRFFGNGTHALPAAECQLIKT